MSTQPQDNRTSEINGEVYGPPESDWSLRDLVELLRRNWLIIVLCGVLALVPVWWQQRNFERNHIPQYRATVLMQRQAEESPIEAMGLFRQRRSGEDFASQLRVIRSTRVLGPVIDSAGLRLDIADGRRGAIAEDVRLAADASEGRFRLVQNDDQVHLREAGTDRDVASATPGAWLFGPAFGLRLRDDIRLEEPAEVIVFGVDDAIDELKNRLRVDQEGETNLLRIAYDNPDPELAAAVANAVARSYQLYAAEQARDRMVRQREFLAEQVAAMSDSLQTEQARLQQYQGELGIGDPNMDAQAITNQLVAAEDRLRDLQFQEELVVSALAAMDAGSPVEDAFQRILAMGGTLLPSAQALHQRLQGFQSERQSLTASRYGALERQPQVDRLDSLIAITKTEMRDGAERSLVLLRERLADAEARIAELRSEARELPSQLGPYARQQQRVQAVQEIYNMMASRYYEAQMAAAVEMGNIEIVDPATVPQQPVPVRQRFGYIMALLVGLGLGGGLAFVREQLDTTLRSPDEVRRVADLEILGMVPAMSGRKNGATRPLPVLDGHSAAGAESFRSLRTMLRFSSADRPKVIAVTSPEPAAGKTTVAVNLAAAMAQQGDRILLIDSDLRRPLQHKVFGKSQSPGLTDVLVGEASVKEALHDLTSTHTSGRGDLAQRLWLMTAGSKTPNPAELLGSKAFGEFLERARGQFDAVIVDTAPVLAVTDAVVVGAAVDGMLLVTAAEESDRETLSDAVGQLRQARVPLLGMVLNKVPEKGRYYGYHVGRFAEYYLEADEEKGSGKGSAKRGKRIPAGS